VRERLVEGDTDGEVLSFIVERYGEYVIDPDTGLRVYIQSSD